MKKNKKKVIYISYSLVFVTGVVVFILKRYFHVETEWGETPHYALGDIKFAHFLSMVFFIFSLGRVFDDHIVKKLRYSKKKISGSFLLFSLSACSVSGLLLLFSFESYIRDYVGVIHFLLGLGTFFCLIFHVKFSVYKRQSS